MDADAAIKACTQIRAGKESSPDQARALYSRGRSYFAKKDFDRAIADFTAAIKLDPKFTAAFADRANAYIGKQDYGRALADFNEAIRLDPKMAIAYSDRGYLHELMHQYAEAVRDHDESIRLDPNNALSHNNRGHTLSVMGEHERALQDFDEAVRLDATLAAAYYNRGSVYNTKGDYQAAIADFTRAIELNPRYAAAFRTRSVAFLFTGDYDRAAADASRAIELDARDRPAFNNRGRAYLEKGNFGLAIDDLTRAIELMPTHGPSQDVQACGKEAFFELLNRDADDVQAALAVIAQRPDADPTRVISTGVSAGGAASIALAARDIPGLRAIVSVAGGGEPVLAPCYIAASVPVDYGYFGSHTKIPSLWVFAKNDPLHPPGQVEVMRKAFTAGGGKLKVVELDPLDDDSHEAMGSMQGRTEWLAGADRFLRDNKLPTWQPSDVDELLHKLKWKAAGRSYLETYMSAPVQKAFAQSKKTDYGTFYAAATLEEARDKALKACEEKAPPCHIVIENFTYVGP